MKSDISLKELYRFRARDLLPLTGDAGAKVFSARPREFPATTKSADLVMRLWRGGETYLRHIEFQAEHRGNVARRCFDYASTLAVRTGLPVLTTVVYLWPSAPRELAFRQVLAGRLVNEWRFDVVRLWELSAQRLLALGPGGAALAPLAADASLPLIARASRVIQRRGPRSERKELLAILQVFAERRYTARQLARVVPGEMVMGSGLIGRLEKQKRAEGLAEGLAKGLAKGLARGRALGREEGRAEGLRRVCIGLAREHHPAVASRVIPAIRACAAPRRLERWALLALRLTDEEFARLVARESGARATQRRAPRPSRRARRG